jgi:hypothetical protein
MKTIWSNKIESILKMGKPLDSIGVNNWALSKKEALIAIEKLTQECVPILGGDVYEMINGRLKSTYDSWYCDIEEDESENSFLIRSIDKAGTYIRKYNARNANAIYFVIVPKA